MSRCNSPPLSDVLLFGLQALLLVCDAGCGRSQHTYCCNYGNQVPDGNWYCPPCAALMAPSHHPEEPEAGGFSEEHAGPEMRTGDDGNRHPGGYATVEEAVRPYAKAYIGHHGGPPQPARAMQEGEIDLSPFVSNSASGYRGVYPQRGGRFKAIIQVKRKASRRRWD